MATREVRSPIAWTAPSLTVLVPALNERGNLEPTIDQVLQALAITVEDYEIIIVDDGSADGTAETADRLAAQHPEIRTVHNPGNMGLGYSYLRGIDLASKNYLVYVPADNTWPFRSLVELFGTVGKSDIVTSYVSNPEVRPLGRRTVSRWYTRVLNMLFRRRLRYYNGITIYPITFLRTRPITTYGFGFQAEVLLRAIDRGLSCTEVPLAIEERTVGGSKALRIKNITSVITTIARLFWDLRVVRGSRRGTCAPRSGIHAPASGAAVPSHSGTEGGRPEPLRILITGASTGIGAGLMEALAADGHTLFVCARHADILNRATRQNSLARGRACDVSDEGQVREFIGWVRTQTPHLDALIHCAGVIGAIGPAGSTDSQAWWDTLRVNLLGTYLMSKHALPLLEESHDPRILFFSGGGAFAVRPNYSAHACSKAAVVRLTECLAAELAPRGIAVNAVAPGFVATDHHHPTLQAGPERAGALAYRRTKVLMESVAPRSAASQIGNVADCVRMLLSPWMRGLTGKTISVNFDPWRTTAFRGHIDDISRSDLYTLRRINIVNLPEGALRSALAGAAGDRR